jgi:glycosyltransferase involved in cell wall biosynthesis/SAM-dependent methyltransferase
MFAGAIVEHKCVHILLEAFSNVLQVFPDAQLHIYGSATMWHEGDTYERAMMTKSLEIGNVYFYGSVPKTEMPLVYSQHSIVCVPSQLESFGLVAVEAQACGCIPVVHNSGGVSATLLDGKTGFLYSPNTAEELAHTIMRVLTKIESGESIRENAVSFVTNTFDTEKIVNSALELIHSLINSKSSLAHTNNTKMTDPSFNLNDIKHLLIDSIRASTVKHRVYALISKLTTDQWLNLDLQKYFAKQENISNWFDSVSFLNWYAHSFKPRNYLEVGVRRGRSIAQVLVESPDAEVYGFDMWISDYADAPNPGPEFVMEELGKLNIKKLPTLIMGDSHETLPLFFADPNKPQEFDLINIDGDHSYDGAKLDLEIAFAHLAPGGALLFDDIRHNGCPELGPLWNEFKAKFPDYIFIEDYSGTGTGIGFKPPFTKIATFLLSQDKSIYANKSQVSFSEKRLVIHFFTIVLNGEPFVRYHIDILKQLPFKWHWHIVEGVADLKHDTAWSLELGGNITNELHRNGRSNDGTSEYLDRLKAQYPENITIYRKPEGVFWNGKREMVSAPLANINEECLLWQVDVDELWTVDQILTAREMFINNPDKTAAWYWCWYFVGKDLVVTTRQCYTQNPNQEWLRTWRFKPGFIWEAHEPPRLIEVLPNGQRRDVATVNPFCHDETEEKGLVFQHFAYVTVEQLSFKEKYYGYKDAVSQWLSLQNNTNFPVLLREYLGWVKDDTIVGKAESYVNQIAFQKKDGTWAFKQLDESSLKMSQIRVIVDGVFFQLNNTGIARVWKSLLEEWVRDGFAKNVTVIDRAETAPKISGIRYRTAAAYHYDKTELDRQMLQQICDEEGADIFISTYYTTPILTPSIFMGYDMIPELTGHEQNNPQWREKHYAIQNASAYLTISENTARDLMGYFTHISPNLVTVAHCGISSQFYPVNHNTIDEWKNSYGISKPYFLLVGERIGWQGCKNCILFFKAFEKLPNRHDFSIVCAGGKNELEPEFQQYISDCQTHILRLTDEELATAYSGAIALIYPSLYEGFGMPILEAMSCGCPVITCANSSIKEVAGSSALYVNSYEVDSLVCALQDIQRPQRRNPLIAAGLDRAKKFSWSKMAQIVKTAIRQTINATNPTKVLVANNNNQETKQVSDAINIDQGKVQKIPNQFTVSAIISTYNSEQFIQGCLEDLVEQTLYKQGKVEIIIIDSASEQNEQAIIRNFQAKYPNIIYERTIERETIYSAWNRAVKMSRGTYITNANTDDRHRPDALEFMAKFLDKNPDVSLVYANQLITTIPNDTWVGTITDRCFNWPSFEYETLKMQCIVGPQPMWKKSLHNKYGYFKAELRSAGDYEFWLRIAKYEKCVHLDEILGIYYYNPHGLSTSNGTVGTQETHQIWQDYGVKYESITPLNVEGRISSQELNALPYRQSGQEITTKSINKAFLEKQVEFWNVSSLNEAMFYRVLTDDAIIQMSEEDQWKAWEQSVQPSVQAILETIPWKPEWKVLEIGCGVGRLIKAMREIFTLVDGVDISEKMIQFGKQYLAKGKLNGNLYVNNGSDLQELKNESYDFVYSMIVFQHIRSISVVKSYFREIFRVLKPTGYFRVQVHEYQDVPGSYAKFDEEADAETQYCFAGNGYTVEQLTQLLREPGFEINSIEGKSPWIWATVQRPMLSSPRIPVVPLVSVIIPTRNRPNMLNLAVESVLSQNYKNVEIIVVNDGGVDVQSVISRLNTKGNIVYKKHDRALDRSAARNTGIRAARGKYIAYLDDDDIYYPNHIETLVKFLENSEYKIAYTDAVMAQQEKQNGEYVTVQRSVPYSLDFDKDKILVSNCTPNLCLMHEKSCFDEVGLFDETLSTHEDWDLIIRLSRKFDIAHIKETTCEFTQRNDGTNTSSHNRADFTRTREVIFNQYRQYAEANSAILAAQKEAFIAEAKELAQQVQNLQSQVIQKESHLQQTQAEKSQLAAQLETWQRSAQQVQAKLEATQSEKEGVKSQLNSWKQTAEEMQIELDRSRSKLKQAQSQLERSAFPLSKS